jgi:uncharacterized protein (UPF0303 family)
MEGTKKLTVEIELSEEEAERFERFIDEGCYDLGKFLRRLILGTIERKQKSESRKSTSMTEKEV